MKKREMTGEVTKKEAINIISGYSHLTKCEYKGVIFEYIDCTKREAEKIIYSKINNK
jgi:hypothetical protein